MSDRRWLALCGSLRAESSNRALLMAAQRIAPRGVTIEPYEGLADLPPFNPDIEQAEGSLPDPVRRLRQAVGASQALLIACPEYAHGVPGAFKNLLDWLVGSLEFPDKPVALLNAAARASHAQSQLAEILRTMNAHLLSDLPWLVPLPHNRFDAAAILADEALRTALRLALDDIARQLSRN